VWFEAHEKWVFYHTYTKCWSPVLPENTIGHVVTHAVRQMWQLFVQCAEYTYLYMWLNYIAMLVSSPLRILASVSIAPDDVYVKWTPINLLALITGQLRYLKTWQSNYAPLKILFTKSIQTSTLPDDYSTFCNRKLDFFSWLEILWMLYISTSVKHLTQSHTKDFCSNFVLMGFKVIYCNSYRIFWLVESKRLWLVMTPLAGVLWRVVFLRVLSWGPCCLLSMSKISHKWLKVLLPFLLMTPSYIVVKLLI